MLIRPQFNANAGEPRWLSPDSTAAYIGVRVERLRPLVKAGKLPPPSYHLGPNQPRFDRLALDRAFEDDKVEAPTDARAAALGVANDILHEKARAGRRHRRGVHLPQTVRQKADPEGC